MKLKLIVVSLALLLTTAVVAPCFAAVEWGVQKKLQLDAPPVDVAVSLDDKWVFVLTDRGEVLVFTKDGSLKEKIPVGKHINQLKVGPRDNLLYLGSRKNKTVEIVELDFIQTINTAGSPFKGPADAPAVIAVFTDFE